MHYTPWLISSFYVFLSKDIMPLHQVGLVLRCDFNGNNAEKGLHIVTKICDRYLPIKERYCFYDSNRNNTFPHFMPTPAIKLSHPIAKTFNDNIN